MQAKLAVWAIGLYRKHLSHRKGYKCAYGVATGVSTCSTVGLRAFKRAGWIKGWALLMRQFDRCAICAENLTMQAGEMRQIVLDESMEEPSLTRASSGAVSLGVVGSRQGGFVDCSGCDASGCDAPSCDLPSCDLPSCEMPSCSLPDMPS